jgi:hypothetical protein
MDFPVILPLAHASGCYFADSSIKGISNRAPLSPPALKIPRAYRRLNIEIPNVRRPQQSHPQQPYHSNTNPFIAARAQALRFLFLNYIQSGTGASPPVLLFK